MHFPPLKHIVGRFLLASAFLTVLQGPDVSAVAILATWPTTNAYPQTSWSTLGQLGGNTINLTNGGTINGNLTNVGTVTTLPNSVILGQFGTSANPYYSFGASSSEGLYHAPGIGIGVAIKTTIGTVWVGNPAGQSGIFGTNLYCGISIAPWLGGFFSNLNVSATTFTGTLAATNAITLNGTNVYSILPGSGVSFVTNGTIVTISGVTPVYLGIAASDEVTALTTGTNKVTFRAPFAFTLTSVRGSLTTNQTTGGLLTFDVLENGTSVFSTKPTFDNNEKTTTTAATPSVLSDTAIADDSEIEVNITAIGTSGATGLKVWLIGTKP